ncbi:hypothetical protein PMAYCL1PPCAC_17322, partial [Pristionchus mayeri]
MRNMQGIPAPTTTDFLIPSAFPSARASSDLSTSWCWALNAWTVLMEERTSSAIPPATAYF